MTDGTEQCAHCGSRVVTTPGMDAFTEVTDYTTTERTREVYCNRECLSKALRAETDGGLPPRPPEPERDWICPGCDTAYHGKPEHVTEDPFRCFCSDECFEQYSTDTDRDDLMTDGGVATSVFDRMALRQLAAERIDEPRREQPENARLRVPELVRSMREIEEATLKTHQRGDISRGFALGIWTALAGVRYDFGIEDSRYVDTETDHDEEVAGGD